MELLSQFLLRLTFGLAFGMAITSPRLVTSGFFRNHLYVTLGLSAFAAMVSQAAAPGAFWYAVAAAIASYVGSVCWLYEKHDAGKVAIGLVAFLTLIASQQLLYSSYQKIDQSYLDKYFQPVPPDITAAEFDDQIRQDRQMGYLSGALAVASNLSSALLLGLTLAAMFLGHWYLNSPTMELAPLRRLLKAMGAAVALQAAVSAIGLACELRYSHELSTPWMLFILLRWSFGLVGVAALAWMAWQTLKIPNTQSATGILYVAVIGVFVGELTAALLSATSAFPL
jgi:hypothetical protein